MNGDLAPGEAHPAAFSAKAWLAALGVAELLRWQEAFASCALTDNRSAEISGETLRRLLAGEPVSDRYLLGLAWVIREGIKTNMRQIAKGGS